MKLKWTRDSYVASKRTDSVGELYLVKVNVHQTLKRPPSPPPSTGGVLEGLYWINSIHQIALALCWITPELTSCTSVYNPPLSQTASPRTESLTTEIRVPPFRSNTCALLFVTHQSHSRFSSSEDSASLGLACVSLKRHSQDSVQQPFRSLSARISKYWKI